jgi:hypothetical protein
MKVKSTLLGLGEEELDGMFTNSKRGGGGGGGAAMVKRKNELVR